MSAAATVDKALVLALEDVVSGYGQAPVIHGVSLVLAPGEILAVLGKNGMGKSTLLKTIMGLVPCGRGRIQLLGGDITGLATHRIARRHLTYTPQEQTLFQDLTVADNLRLGVATEATFRRGLELIAGHFPIIPQRLKQRAGTLSGGEQKMLLLSRALMAEPRVMLIDEISEGLQPSMVTRVGEALRAERRRTGVALLLVEQNLAFALATADRYAVLKRGEIVDRGDARSPAARTAVSEHLRV
ncbi:MAG: ABC transporter ATP-binding protein [Candidatus Competibacterales bacterium]